LNRTKTLISALLLVTATGCSADERAPVHSQEVALAQVANGSGAADVDAPAQFVGEIDGEPVKLTMATMREGPVSGALSGLDVAMFLTGTRSGGRLNGELSGPGVRMAVRGAIDGDSVRLLLQPMLDDDEELEIVLRRAGSADALAASAGLEPRMPSRAQTVVNDKVLTNADRARFERDYGLRIVDGSYWYDPACGAWGLEGGPTMGYLLPGMPLGGALRADASGSQTPVFVNGRALHSYDLIALQMLVGQVYSGRYFLDARGNFGREGGPPLINLVALQQAFIAQQQAAQLYGPGWGGGGGPAQGAGGGSGGGDGGWYSGITGAGGNESGGSGYVMGDGWSVSY
jgi:hypothetical protein